MNRRPDLKSWSAAECFQHLLFTNGLYLKHFSKVNKTESSNTDRTTNYRHSFWGKFILYFINPTTKIKSKTSAPFNPLNNKVKPDMIKKYLKQNEQLVKAIFGMKNLGLRKLKMPSPINDKIKYNLDDVIEILVLHDQRHIQQAKRVLNAHRKNQ